MKLSGAKIVLECLLEHKVNTVFGYPGGNILGLYDALYDYQDKIRHILNAHEQGACHSADGYARASGDTGVVLATSGPGATNLVTGIANAYMDSIPLVAITGTVPLHMLGRDSFQEVDIFDITMPITKENFIVKDIDSLASTIRQAFYIANHGRKGPVLVDIPKNLFEEITEYKYTKPLEIVNINDDKNIQDAVKLIDESTYPLIYMGGGIISSNAYKELADLTKKLSPAIVSSLMGLSAFPSSHKHFLGMVGMHGHKKSNLAVKKADLIIAVGCRFSDRVATNRETFSSGKKIIHIDIDNAEINKNIKTTTHLLGDCKYFLNKLCDKIKPKNFDKWQTYLNTIKSNDVTAKCQNEQLTVENVLKCIKKHVPSDQIIATDVGQHQMWTAQNYDFETPRTFITSGGLGTMGFGLGASIGASIAKSQKAILITGDGSFHMNMNEFATCIREDIPVIVFVMNNNVLGMVRQLQKVSYNSRFSQTSINFKTDYIKLSEAFGGVGYSIKNTDDIEKVVLKALNCKKPVIVNVELTGDKSVLPMVLFGGNIDNMLHDIKEEN